MLLKIFNRGATTETTAGSGTVSDDAAALALDRGGAGFAAVGVFKL